MIWLTTVFLLVIFAHLLREAIKEKRLYEASMGDAAQTADDGLVMGAIQRFQVKETDDSIPLTEENSALGRAVSSVTKRSAKAGDYLEKKAAASLQGDDSESMFARVLNKVSSVNDKADQKLDQRIQRQAGSESDELDRSPLSDDSMIAKVANKLRDRDESADEKMRAKIEQTMADEAEADSENPKGFFNKAVNKVGSQMEKAETGIFNTVVSRVASRFNENPPTVDEGKEDLIFRASGKIGQRMNEVDDRIVESGKKVLDRSAPH